ncbi:MAG: AIPR family protein [Flavobacterium sp.]|nr:AIPR family protein [Flavobacterium sp.]
MLTDDFYKIIDTELTAIIEKYKDDNYIKKNKSATNNQKAYALLIWFLEFYGKKTDYSSYITDGDEDSSCDIVFDNLDNQGQRVFYIVQSKWNIETNCNKIVDKKDILQALNDFDTILRGKKEKVSTKLKTKIDELQAHQRANGDVKFIYLTLSNNNSKADDNIKSFIENHKRTRFDFYDINRLKVDYIERRFKKIDPINPLENYYNPEESKIHIEVQRINPTSGNYIRVDKPFEAYVFLIKPKTIFELFEKYGFSLFFRNVRNPLITSDFNREIEETATDNPAYFWYYNNGLTAITYLIPEVRDEATTIELIGLQIINGAQTVYSIYKAYSEANPTKRSIIDSEALITLRLLKSGGRDFDLKVTRYTNSQNPVNERDFRANDDIQVRLQNEFYSTNYWYEKRRGEFRTIPKGVKRVPNIVFANCYLAYQLQDPVGVLNNYRQRKDTRKDLLFVSHKDHKDGLYEKIFNKDSKFEDFVTSFYLLDIIIKRTSFDLEDTFSSNLYHLLSFFKIVFTKYCKSKFGEKININLHVQKLYNVSDTEIIVKIFKFINEYLEKEFNLNGDEKSFDKFVNFLTSSSQYERVKGKLEEIDINSEAIESIELKEDEEVVNIMKNDEDEEDKNDEF